jgi:hypothetical protein
VHAAVELPRLAAESPEQILHPRDMERFTVVTRRADGEIFVCQRDALRW